MKYQFRDLKAQYQALKEPLEQAILTTAAGGQYIGGEPVLELEAKLAAYVGVSQCVTCGNGTDALTLALRALAVGKGDAVFVPDFTFFASGEIVSALGAVPVFVDVDSRSYNMDAASLEKAVRMVEEEGSLTPKAVIAVDLFGLPADFAKIRSVADRYGLRIVEDAAQGFGGKRDGRRAGSFGDLSTTSFFPAKPLGCCGDGGAVFTDDAEAADLMRSLRVHGKGASKYDNVRIGYNSRLDTLQAAILSVKFDALTDYEQSRIQAAADRYTRILQDAVTVPEIPEGTESAWAQYTIRLQSKKQRDAVKEKMNSCGIPTMIYYPKPMHEMQAFKDAGMRMTDCPQTILCCDTVLSLPLHPYMTEEMTSDIAETLLKSL